MHRQHRTQRAPRHAREASSGRRREDFHVPLEASSSVPAARLMINGPSVDKARGRVIATRPATAPEIMPATRVVFAIIHSDEHTRAEAAADGQYGLPGRSHERRLKFAVRRNRVEAKAHPPTRGTMKTEHQIRRCLVLPPVRSDALASTRQVTRPRSQRQDAPTGRRVIEQSQSYYRAIAAPTPNARSPATRRRSRLDDMTTGRLTQFNAESASATAISRRGDDRKGHLEDM